MTFEVIHLHFILQSKHVPYSTYSQASLHSDKVHIHKNQESQSQNQAQ